MTSKIFIISVFTFILFFKQIAISQEVAEATSTDNVSTSTPLDPEVQIKQQDKVSTVFRDMVVVQRKAKDKDNKILTNVYMSFDFSDGPNTMYGINTNIGYAFSDFFEVYLNFVPAFIVQDRDIVDKIKSITVEGGGQASITYAEPDYQYGLEFLWAPAYGKDSWSPYSIVRSDTFFKFSIGQIKYDSESGMRYALTIGKTFFLSKWFNIRLATGLVSAETIVDGKKSANTMATIESGLVLYF
jgi:hypothetical protein